VAAVVGWAESEGATIVRLEVMQSNDRARRFYERNGFHPTGQQAVRETGGRIEVQMQMPLPAPGKNERDGGGA
jgi:RimJ/RimL family protein N-acetyltransferase